MGSRRSEHMHTCTTPGGSNQSSLCKPSHPSIITQTTSTTASSYENATHPTNREFWVSNLELCHHNGFGEAACSTSLGRSSIGVQFDETMFLIYSERSRVSTGAGLGPLWRLPWRGAAHISRTSKMSLFNIHGHVVNNPSRPFPIMGMETWGGKLPDTESGELCWKLFLPKNRSLRLSTAHQQLIFI